MSKNLTDLFNSKFDEHGKYLDELQSIFNATKPDSSLDLLESFTQVGPLNVRELISQEKLEVDYSLPIMHNLDVEDSEGVYKWSGQVKDGQPIGFGRRDETIKRQCTDVFYFRDPDGHLDKYFARIFSARGNYYIGWTKDGKLHGKGKLVSKHPAFVQEGEWEDGNFLE